MGRDSSSARRRREAEKILAAAKTEQERIEAVEKAVELGMPFYQIEAYLDWLDSGKSRDAD